jgi:hypothetical protein
MSTIPRILFGVAVSLVVSMMPIGLAVSAPAEQTSTRPPHQDQHGSRIILRVRALVPEQVKLSDPAQGTVQATVLAIDDEINQVKVQTEKGQQLMLFLDPASLARLHVGTPCLLQVANGATRDISRPPEHEGAFW